MKRLHPIALMLAATLVGLTTAGCVTRPPPKPPSYAVLLDNPDGSVGAITITGTRGQILVNRSRFGATLDGSAQPCIFDQTQLESDFGAVLAARPQLPVSFLLYFEGTGTTLTAESQAQIARILAAVANRPVPDVSIIGHTNSGSLHYRCDFCHSSGKIVCYQCRSNADYVTRLATKRF